MDSMGVEKPGPAAMTEGGGGSLGRDSLVVMMQAADLWDLDDAASINGMDHSPFRAVHLQRLMGTPVVVVAKVGGEDSLEMPFVDHDDMI